MILCPRVDERTPEEIAAQVRDLLGFYAPEVVVSEDDGSPASAMVRIFARYSELIIDRLNRAPEKNALAFLNLTGMSPIPPRAASVPLTFYLSAQTTESVVVPARTQVAAELAKGETKPVVFETEREFVVVPATIESLIYKNGQLDLYRNWKNVVGPSTPPSSDHGTAAATSATASTASDARPLPHLLFIGVKSRVRWPEENEFRLNFDIDNDPAGTLDACTVQWELCTQAVVQAKSTSDTTDDRTAAIVRTPLTPKTDETEGLSHSGTVVFQNLRQPTAVDLAGFSGVWLCCRLVTPITTASEPQAGMVRSGHISPIKDITADFDFEEENIPVELILFNSAPVDATKEFYPFGERPKFGDTLYLASSRFSDPDAHIEVQVELTNPTDATGSPIPPVAADSIKLAWEFWDGHQWSALGVGDTQSHAPARQVRFVREDSPPVQAQSGFSDTTQALTHSGTVAFQFSTAPAPSVVMGKSNYWIRVRILAGGYGTDVSYERNAANGQLTVTPATFAPPSIRSIKVDVRVNASSSPAAITCFNDFTFQRVDPGTSFQPFIPTADTDLSPSIYLGLLPPKPTTAASSATLSRTGQPLPGFSGRSMSFYIGVDDRSFSAPDDSRALNCTWEYWNGSEWAKWTVRDGTRAFERSGLLRVLAPSDFQLREEFGVTRYWLRMRKGLAGFDPKIDRVLLNSTMAVEGATLIGEVLGASNGRGNQTFKTTQKPILEGQRLEVREPRRLTPQEERMVIAQEGPDAIGPPSTAQSTNGQIWVRWHEVSSFTGSGPRDRVYMLDRLSGGVRFGDGVNGQIPPVLPGNISMSSYRAGGGAKGNKPARTIKQLKTAVPSVAAVLNWVDAGGGGDPETTAALLDRGPRILRHGNRAVTVEDFEDLARAASTQVARARCFPVLDARKPLAEQRSEPGVTSIVVLPRSTDRTPLASGGLLEAVQSYLADHCSPLLRLIITGPRYMPVDVQTEVSVDDPDTANDIELAITLALEHYLHPVTGGRDGSGWEFGRRPHKSDLWILIGKIKGISHIRSLNITVRHPPDAEGNDSQCIVCAGNYHVSATLKD